MAESVSDLMNQRNKLIELTIRSIDIMEWVAQCSEDSIASEVAKGQAEISIIRLRELGVERYGVIGQVMNENYGWFGMRTASEFRVILPAWIMTRNGVTALLSAGIGE